MNAEPSGQDALNALVDAQHMLAAIGALQQRTTDLGMRLQRARDRAQAQVREAVDLIKRFAESDPAQLGVELSPSAAGVIDAATKKVMWLEAEVADVVRAYEDGGGAA